MVGTRDSGVVDTGYGLEVGIVSIKWRSSVMWKLGNLRGK